MRIKLLRLTIATMCILMIWGTNVYVKGDTGELDVVSITSTSFQAGNSSAIYTYEFTTSATGNGSTVGIPASGIIRILFPTSFSIGTPIIAQSNNSNLTGGFSDVSTKEDIVEGDLFRIIDLTRDNTGNNIGTSVTVSIRIGNVINSTTTGVDSIYIQTKEYPSGTPIDDNFSWSHKTPYEIEIVPGSLGNIKIEDAAGGTGSEVGAISGTADENTTLYAVGYDDYGNFVSNIDVNWVVSGDVGNVAPGSGTSTTLTLTHIGTGQVSADDGDGHGDNTGTITVTAGAELDYIIIVEGNTGDGAELDTREITTDQTLTVHAAGYDNYDNYIGEVSVDWSVVGDIGDVSPISGPTTVLNATTPGLGQVHAEHASAGTDNSTIIVSLGNLNHTKILSGSLGETLAKGDTTLTVGDNLIVHAGGYDGDGNYINDVSVSWDVIGGIGSIPAGPSISAQFEAEQVGQGNLKAVHGTAGNVYSGLITVTKGPIDHIVLQSEPGDGGSELGNITITADDSLIIYAAAYDAGNNYISLVSVDWSQTAVGDGLEPDISGSGSAYTFKPTKSGANGKIHGHHATIADDSTGTITVIPGVPAGFFTLMLDSTELSADSTEFTAVTSDTIRDGDSNKIAADKLFTISVSPAGLGVWITSSGGDQDAGLAGHQVKSDIDGQITFNIHAGTVGGTAFISANSVDGSAHADTSIALSAIRILSIVTDKAKVSQGQDDINVKMKVQNNSPKTIKSINAALKFIGPGSEDWGHYYVTSVTPIDSIEVGQTGEIDFVVNVINDAPTGTVTVDGTVSGYAGSTFLEDNTADVTDSWLVQTRPQLNIIKVFASDETVEQGTKTNVSMVVENAGMADAVIVSDSVIFRLNREPSTLFTHEYSQTPDFYNPDIINGGEHVTLKYSITIGTDATEDEIKLDGKISAKDINTDSVFTDLNADTTDIWMVEKRGEISIDQFYTSQTNVTIGQVTPWTATLKVKNNFETTIVTLDRAELKFVSIGSEDTITVEYDVSYDNTFIETGDDTLNAHSTETLEFTINKTGETIGWVKIIGTVYLNDGTPNQIIISRSTNIYVQSPSDLAILDVIPSQPEVTTNQTKDWQIEVVVKNTGESDIKIDLSSDSTYIKFNTGSDFIVEKPGALEGAGNSILLSGVKDNLIFNVNGTGATAGICKTIVQLAYVDTIASEDILYISNDDAQVTVETPPNIFISKTVNIAPNTPYVNTEQDFQILAKITNTGEDGVHGVQVLLSPDGGSSITQPNPISVEGNSTDSVLVNITAANNWNLGEIFTAVIDTAIGDNTPEFDSTIIAQSPDTTADTTIAKIQVPADITITDVFTMQDTVEAVSQNWKVYVEVTRNGAGKVKFDELHEDSLKFFLDGELQNDYYFNTPVGFKNAGGLIFSGWDFIKDTLVYTIDKAGQKSGEATIEITLTGKYLNNDSSFVVSDTGSVFVLTTAALRIVETEPDCPHVDGGVGILSSSQAFNISVTINNSGVEQVDSVWVSLTSSDIVNYPDTSIKINSIDADGELIVNFPFIAQQAEQQVEFSVKIDSAKSHLSGQPAFIGNPYDEKATVEIQDRADLSIKINPEDNAMTMGVTSHLRFWVENSGTAETDNSGEVTVYLPDAYKIMTEAGIDSESVVVHFVTDSLDTLNIIPPDYLKENDQIRITISKLPDDVNTKLPAYVTVHEAIITVKTDTSVLNINTEISEPNGAMDGVVSTEQLFKVYSTFQKSDNIKELEATLILPDGYNFDDGEDTTKSVISNEVEWTVKAPVEEHSTEKEIIVNVIGNIGEEDYSNTDTLQIVTEDRAELYIRRFEILEADSTLSIGQDYTISATVINDGSAAVTGTGTISIDVGATGITIQEDTLKTFTEGNSVTWQAKAPDVVTGLNPIFVKIVSIPNDVNTGVDAVVPDKKRSLSVSTENAGAITISNVYISSPDGAKNNTLSTSQNFKVTAELSWSNCADKPEVSIEFSGDFETLVKDKYPEGTSTQGIAAWTMTAPSEKALNKNIWVEAKAYDKNNNEQEINVTSGIITVHVVDKAKINLKAEIIGPDDAVDGIVSTSQNFTIMAALEKYGDAATTDSCSYRLTLPHGEGYTTNSDFDQRVLHNEQVQWTITAAPSARDAKKFEIELVELPDDENTNEDAAIIRDYFSIPVTTEEKSISISVLPRRANNSLAKGDSSIPMLGLQFDCSGDEASSKVLFSGVGLKLKDKYGDIISDPRSAISKISVVKYLADSVVYGEVSEVPASDSIYISFTRIDTIHPTIPNKVEFLFDIANNATATDFQVAIDSLYMIDAGSGNPPLFQLNGVTTLESEFSVIVPQNFDKAFWNYPNPFGSSGRTTTTIQYYLDQNCDIELKIFTLLGELVWSVNYNSSEPQGQKGLHDGATAITWDAHNKAEQTVLNGVYVARLSTSYGKSVITKIAVLK